MCDWRFVFFFSSFFTRLDRSLVSRISGREENDRVPPAVPLLPDIFVLNIFALEHSSLLRLRDSGFGEMRRMIQPSLFSSLPLVINADDLLCTHFLLLLLYVICSPRVFSDDDWFLHPAITFLPSLSSPCRRLMSLSHDSLGD